MVLYLKRQEAKIERLREKADAVAALYENMNTRHASGFSRVENAAVNLVDAENEYKLKKAEFAPKIAEARKVTEHVRSDTARRMLQLRYLDGKDWPEIMALLAYDNSMSMWKMHGRALAYAYPWIPGNEDDGLLDPYGKP